MGTLKMITFSHTEKAQLHRVKKFDLCRFCASSVSLSRLKRIAVKDLRNILITKTAVIIRNITI